MDIALLNTLFTKSDFYDKNFHYDNYDFIAHDKLKVIDPTLSLKRSVYDAIYSNKIISWKPYKKYIFFNATHHGETRTFYATDIIEDLRLQQINFTAPLTDYIHMFEGDSSFPPHRLKLSYSGLIANPEKSPQENVSLFVERIAVSRYDVNKNILYNQGLEIKWEDEVKELAKEIFIPFYSCIRGVEIEDPNQIVIDCTIDIVFTARPFLKGVVKATTAFAKAPVAEILERIVSAPRFLSKGDSITLNAVKLKNVITSQYIKTSDLEKLTFDLLKLFAEAFDPGLMALYDLQHGAYHALKSISLGNPMPLYAHFITKGKEITEVIIKTKNLIGIRQSMIKISQTYSRGTTFTQYPTLTASASSDIFHMQIDGGDYNAFFVSNQTYVMSGDTGEISNDGHRVFAMIDVKSGMGILIKFICVQNPQVPGCTVIPWHPSSDLADSIIRPLHIKRNKHRQQWVFDLALVDRTLSYYPGHSAMIVGDDSQGDRIYEIFEIDHAYFLFNPDTGQIRAMQAGDILFPFEKNGRKGFYKIRINRKGRLVVQKNRKGGHWPKRKLAPYALAMRDCLKRKIMLHDNNNLLIGKMYQACVILNLDPIKNHYRIETKYRLWPAIKVGWSEINSMFMPIKPNNGENSLAVSIDLDDYMLKQAGHCQGILPQSFPIQLLNGEVMLKGEHWLKIHGHYHHLGEWQGEYRVLYCGNTTQIATWLRYEPLTENFEIVASPFGQRSLSDAPISSYLSRMVNRLYPEDDWPTHYSLADVHDSFLSGDDLSLRLRQTALLQRLAPGERMALLSLPSAQIYSWSMHPDAMALRSRYPVLSLWLSWQCQIFPLLNSTTTPSMRLEKTLTLNNAYINGKAASGSLSAGGCGSHDAIWIQHRAKENSNITLPTAYRLFHNEDTFYGEVIAGTQGMSLWFLEINAPLYPP